MAIERFVNMVQMITLGLDDAGRVVLPEVPGGAAAAEEDSGDAERCEEKGPVALDRVILSHWVGNWGRAEKLASKMGRGQTNFPAKML